MKYALIFSCRNKSRGSSVVSSFRILVDYVVEIRKAATQSRFSEFLLGLSRPFPCFNPAEGCTNDHHLVAATIPQDRL